MKKDVVITKANALIEASYELSLNEQRIVLACASKLDSRKPLPKDNRFTLTADEFADLYGVDMRNAYTELKDATERLFERKITKIDKNRRSDVRWVYRAEYLAKEGMVELAFSPTIAPYLTQLNQRFTSYPQSQVRDLRRPYSIRLFEMMAQFQSTGVLRISIEDFRDRLQLKNKYERYTNLKARVIVPAVKELQDKSSIDITWKPIKQGRIVEMLEFRFEARPQLELENV